MCAVGLGALLQRGGAQAAEVVIKREQQVEVFHNLVREGGGEDLLVERQLMLQREGLLLVPRAQEVAHLALAAGVVRAGQGEDVLPIEAAHELFQLAGRAVDLAAVQLHQSGRGAPEAHAVAIVVRGDLEIERGAARPVILAGADAEPKVVLIRPTAEQAARVAVDTADLELQRLVRQHRVQAVVDLPAQCARRLEQGGLIDLLVLHEPAALIIEADPPEEIHRLLRIALKHIRSPSAKRQVYHSLPELCAFFNVRDATISPSPAFFH